MTTQNETTNNAPAKLAKAWWSGTFVLNFSNSAKAGEKRSGNIYRVLGIESGRLVGALVVIDGAITIDVRPYQFFKVETLIGSMDRSKAGARLFGDFESAKTFATYADVETWDDALDAKDRANAIAQASGQPLPYPAPTLVKAAKPKAKPAAKSKNAA